MKTNTDRELVGYVDVDAGVIMVGDPCYTIGDDASSRVPTWSEFCDRLFDKKNEVHETGVIHPFAADHRGAGIVIPSGYGDGSYPVYIETEMTTLHGADYPRVKSVTVVFIGDEEED
ncbi:DUF4241 domain-containing protein [Arthrobacter sp. 31Y]|uniref:DUF4241 domain-containing protein n=1 Tax=Arthrobacter sp. 31Y TaxID=1115632 RepID=UPI000463B074|nr:hypothetical protein [Arthrobacter sp. 31Y]